MRSTFVFFLCCLVASPSIAIIDTVVDWQAVEVQAFVEGAPVTVNARVQQGKISALAITVRGRRIDVHKSELIGIPKILLRTLRIISPDARSHEGPSVRLEVDLEPLESREEQFGVAYFHFIGSSYQGRFVERSVLGKIVVNEI